MSETSNRLYQAAVWSMWLSAAAVVVSIAVSQIFLGLALIALVASQAPMRFPPLKAPLAAFVAWTLVSLLASPDPGAGLPQVRKFFVFSVLLVVSSALREARHARWLAGAWFVAAAVSALRSLVQFGQKVEEARSRGEDFYQAYVGERITGFLSHWMTFSEVGMLVLLVLVSYLFFAPNVRRRTQFLGWLCAVVLVGSLLVSFTRNVWVAGALAGSYLVWQWRRKWLLAAPVMAIVAVLAAPGAFQRRVQSMVSGQGDQSARARFIMLRTGMGMIQARPLVGVGPQRVGTEFRRYLPADVGELPPAYYDHLHNLYVHYAAERGLPALAALLWLLVRVLRDHRRALKRVLSEDRWVVMAVIAATVAIVVGGAFEVNLGDSEVLTLYLTLVALGYAAMSRTEEAVRCRLT